MYTYGRTRVGVRLFSGTICSNQHKFVRSKKRQAGAAAYSTTTIESCISSNQWTASLEEGQAARGRHNRGSLCLIIPFFKQYVIVSAHKLGYVQL